MGGLRKKIFSVNGEYCKLDDSIRKKRSKDQAFPFHFFSINGLENACSIILQFKPPPSMADEMRKGSAVYWLDIVA